MHSFSKSGFSSVSIPVHLWTKILIVFSLLPLALACSVPNLESAECVESRNALREFYSVHFGNDMLFTPDALKARERFLTPELAEKMKGSREGTDPFTTGNDDIPKAFRAGDCREISQERTAIEVVLFWKDDTRSEERKIKVEMAKRGDTWLVDNITR